MNSKPVTFYIEEPAPICFEVEKPEPVEFSLPGFAVVQTPSEYDGPVVVTPSQQTQVLPTNGTRLTSNIKVNPIPSNYGLITWNGSIITVS